MDAAQNNPCRNVFIYSLFTTEVVTAGWAAGEIALMVTGAFPLHRSLMNIAGASFVCISLDYVADVAGSPLCMAALARKCRRWRPTRRMVENSVFTTEIATGLFAIFNIGMLWMDVGSAEFNWAILASSSLLCMRAHSMAKRLGTEHRLPNAVRRCFGC